jgi:hypothetical protein
MNRHRDSIAREVAKHQGVGVRFELRGKHDAAVLTFGARSRFVIMSKTPSDRRGLQNKLGDVRRTIRDLVSGAGR